MRHNVGPRIEKSLKVPINAVPVHMDLKFSSFRLRHITGQSLPVFMVSGMMDVLWSDLHISHQGRSSKSGDSFYRPFRTA